MKCWYRLLATFLVLILSNVAYAESATNNSHLTLSRTLSNYVEQNDNLETISDKVNFLDRFYGKTPKDGLIIEPFGIHTTKINEGLTDNYLVGIVYKSIAAGTFINSFRDRTFYLGVTRNIYASNGFGVDYFLGALYGYHGKLSTVSGVPLRDSFLWKNNINPVVSIDTYYEISEAFKLQLTITPLVILGGIKYSL
jgi:hypothetical protein